MKTYAEKLDSLWEDAQLSIIRKIREVGKENSKHYTNTKVIKVSEAFAYNLEGDRYLTEISENYGIIDNNGYQYGYGVLDYEQLIDLADWVQTLK